MANESYLRLHSARAIRHLVCLFIALMLGFVAANCIAQQNGAGVTPQWIWTPEHGDGNVPQVSCYFRKTILLPQPRQATIEIAADDEYELYINGQRVARGNSDKMSRHIVGDQLVDGENVIAVKVTNRNGDTAGLAAKLQVNCEGGVVRNYATNPTWRTQTRVLPRWYTRGYRDNRWQAAFNRGDFGQTRDVATSGSKLPSGPQQTAVNPEGAGSRFYSLNKRKPNAEATVKTNSKSKKLDQIRDREENQLDQDGDQASKSQSSKSPLSKSGSPKSRSATSPSSPSDSSKYAGGPRFRLPQGFQVERVAGGDQTGSLIAMSFNEFGHILASREGGPLLMVYDSNDNDIADAVRVCCNKIKNCQGIACVSGHVFVIADGPSGAALYRLDDSNRDGDYESILTVLRFDSPMGEHGPHGLTLGPDGLLYIAVGNHTKVRTPYSLTSPHQNYYEGELITPRYEDPRGHAAGVKAPGGGVIRVDLEGRRPELFAGGLRNAYDLAFNRAGDLFIHDSDMESDAGTTWHRPTRLVHAVAGAEFGWRSGWAKWPDYYIDSLPPTLDTGRGSPTGAIVYDHVAYPKEYRDALFTCDWSRGEINVMKLKHSGASYTAKQEPFLVGRPLNVTDIDVGPDGFIYFTTGGRGTQGNLYRVTWTEEPPKYPKPISRIVEAIMQPQLYSAWGRQAASVIRQEMGDTWNRAIQEYAIDTKRPGLDRARALELMHLLGPPPSDELLAALANDKSPRVRAKAAYFMGLIGNATTTKTLTGLLGDVEPYVRCRACDSLARTGKQVNFDQLKQLLISNDRFEAWSARQLLETNESTEWSEQILATSDVRLFAQAATALLTVAPQKETAKKIADRVIELTEGYLPPNELADLLRVMQLAMVRGPLTPVESQPLGKTLAKKYPAADQAVNRELVRLLVYCQESQTLPTMLEFLESDADDPEKLHVACHLRFVKDGWDARQKVALLQFFETAKTIADGNSLTRFIDRVAKEFTKNFSLAEHEMILEAGDQMPSVAMETLFQIPETADAQNTNRYIDLDRRIADLDGEPYRMLRIGLVAMLARGKDEAAMAYLREVYDKYPERRPSVAMGLAQLPTDRNWDYLVRSIPFLEGEPAREVLGKLLEEPFAPEEPEHLRQVILAGLRLKQGGGMQAVKLLRHWTQTNPSLEGSTWDTALPAWQKWFDETFPARPMAELPQQETDSRWTYEELVAFLDSEAGSMGSPETGEAVYKKAQCAQCHVHGEIGENLGPDLTGLQNRFQRTEILESIVFPSQVISDQYASKTIVTNNGKSLSGLLIDDDSRWLVLESDGTQTAVMKDDVDEILPNKKSSMPDGLLNELTLQEIGDLFAFLTGTTPNEMLATPADDTRR